MSRILVTEFMDKRAVDELAARHDVLYDAALVDDPARLALEAASCDAIVVRNRTQVRGALLAALARCRVVGRLGVGLDNIDVAACESRGMQVIPATGANAQSVAEYVIGTAMMLLRGAYQSTSTVAGGKWPRAALSSGREVAGKTLGLVGFGSIGQLTSRLGKAVGMEVVAHDAVLGMNHAAYAQSGVSPMGLDDLVASADVVSLHLPLTDSTRNLFSASRIGSMKQGAVLINTARGGIVDEIALAQALKDGRLHGAAIDVFASEPLPASAHFDGCPNLVLTPHIAGVTTEANERVSFLVAHKVMEALS